MTTQRNNEWEDKTPTPTSNPNSHVTVIPDPDDPDMVIIRTRKKKRKKRTPSHHKMSRGARIAIIIVAVVVGLLAAAGIALAIAVNMGNVNLHQVFSGSDTENMPTEAKAQDEGQIVEYKGHTYRYNDNIVAVMLIGHDDETGYAIRPDASCADANALITIDTSTNKTRVTVIPRNSWVPVDIYDGSDHYVETRNLQLTLAHAVKLDTIDECAANTTKSVQRIFYGLPITYYVDFDQEVVKEASRAVGGVPVVALETIPGQDYVEGDSIILEGEAAYRYVQYRDVPTFESALDRQERQVQFVKAFMSKAASLGAQGLLNLYNSMSGDITTNLGAPEVAYLISCFVTGEKGGVDISTIKGTTEVYVESNGIEYERYFLDEESVMENTLAAFYTQVD